MIAVGEDRAPVDVSWRELREQVGAVAAWLRSVGVWPGDRVAAYAGNVPETVVAMLATTSLPAGFRFETTASFFCRLCRSAGRLAVTRIKMRVAPVLNNRR